MRTHYPTRSVLPLLAAVALLCASAIGCSDWTPQNYAEAFQAAEASQESLVSQNFDEASATAFQAFLDHCALTDAMKGAVLAGLPPAEPAGETETPETPELPPDDEVEAEVPQTQESVEAEATEEEEDSLIAGIDVSDVPLVGGDEAVQAIRNLETLRSAEAAYAAAIADIKTWVETFTNPRSEAETQRRQAGLAIVEERERLLDEWRDEVKPVLENLAQEPVPGTPTAVELAAGNTQEEALKSQMDAVFADLDAWIADRKEANAEPEGEAVAAMPYATDEEIAALKDILHALEATHKRLKYRVDTAKKLAAKLVYFDSPSAWPASVWVVLIAGILLFYGTLVGAIAYSMIKSGDAPTLPPGEQTGLVHKHDTDDESKE